MNCFVIMPFAQEFDDVYGVIRSTVESLMESSGGRCFRLDDARPAGRISTRLIQELRAASIYVVDITGAVPNVMWELGYATALGKPCILITQDISSMPFDVRDMQALEYERSHLARSLGMQLRPLLIDTLQAVARPVCAILLATSAYSWIRVSQAGCDQPHHGSLVVRSRSSIPSECSS